MSDEFDPFAEVEYTDDLQVDAGAELAALETAYRSRRKAEDQRFRRATDSEYWFAACFQSREEKEAFLAEFGIPGDKYIDGHVLAAAIRARTAHPQSSATDPTGRPLSLQEAAERGDRLAELRAMRLVIALNLPVAPARDMASLSRRQLEIGREIEAIEKAAEEESDEASATPDEPWDTASI